MNKTIKLLALGLLLTHIAQAQVKRQYKDKKFAEQTVVVKEKATTSDLDILNSQFDLDEIAVGEVIRITTETDPTKKVAEAPIEEAVAVVEPTPPAPNPAPVVAPTSTPVVEPTPAPPVQKVVERSPAPKSVSYSSNARRSVKKVRSKKRNPRFKKKKRKRVKRSKNKCYRF